jgi:L-lysine 2,3-aminomutase
MQPAIEAVGLLQKSGAIVNNQCPLIRGINDNPDILAELMRQLSFCGIIPYYLFQCRPTLGNRDYSVPIETAYTLVEEAKRKISGLAKRIRYVMSHATGKIEILAMDDTHIYMKYHRAADDSDSGKFMIYPRNPQACWLDDYIAATTSSSA